jgi:hypothetical protein
VDFGLPGDIPVLQICPSKEKDKVVFQMVRGLVLFVSKDDLIWFLKFV